MILPLPKTFNANEWFIIISSVSFIFIGFTLPRKFPKIIIISILIFIMALAKLSDYILAASIPFDLYDYNDTKSLDLFDEFLHYILYPSYAYLLLYFYDYWRKKFNKKIFFIIIMTVVTTVYEWVAEKLGVFTYKGWNIGYSIITYVFLLTVFILTTHLLEKWYKDLKNKV